jgi:hypothetical protein
MAQDEIDGLFDPKVLTNWKRYTVSDQVPHLTREEEYVKVLRD